MRRCKVCKEAIPTFAKSETFWQKRGYCSIDCTAVGEATKAKAARERAEAAERKKIAADRAKERKAHREAKAKIKDNDKRYQWNLTVKAAQKLGRLLDKGMPCISCGRPDDGSVQFCGGHYRTKGAQPELALDIRNIMGQCNKRCNLELSGNINGNKTTHGYCYGIIKRYGKEYLEWLDSYHQPTNYNCQQLKAIRAEYAAECRKLEKGEMPSKDWRNCGNI